MKKYISVGAVLVVCLLVLSGCTEQQRKDNGQIDPDVRDEQVDTNTNELLEQAISDAILSQYTCLLFMLNINMRMEKQTLQGQVACRALLHLKLRMVHTV